MKSWICKSRRVFKDVYDGGNGEGARIKVVKWACENYAEILRVD